MIKEKLDFLKGCVLNQKDIVESGGWTYFSDIELFLCETIFIRTYMKEKNIQQLMKELDFEPIFNR